MAVLDSNDIYLLILLKVNEIINTRNVFINNKSLMIHVHIYWEDTISHPYNISSTIIYTPNKNTPALKCYHKYFELLKKKSC